MRAQHILIFNWRDPWDPRAGGAERVTLEHAQAWVKKGHIVSWVCGEYAGMGERTVVKDGITYHRRGNAQTLFLRAWWIYRSEFKDVDLIIDEVHGLPMFTPLWKGNTRSIVFIHEVAKEIWNEMFPPPISWMGRAIESTVFPFIYKKEQFWVDAHSTEQDLIDLGISGSQITVIPCAITPYVLLKAPKKENVLTCIFVARLVKMKGIEYTLETFAHILQQEPSAKLWIVGTGQKEYVGGLQQYVQVHHLASSVQFFGLVSEKKKYSLMARAHFLLHTSLREGFGLTVLEANSQKTPAAVFSVPALRDLVDSTKGVIVDFPNTSQLADEIVSVYKDPKRYQRIKNTAHRYASQFTWSTFTQMSQKMLRL